MKEVGASLQRLNAYGATVLAKRVKQAGLTGIAKRFSKREILESILTPRISLAISTPAKVLTLDGESYTGMLGDSTDQTLQLRDSNNQLLVIEEANVDQILPSSSSIMPAGRTNRVCRKSVI